MTASWEEIGEERRKERRGEDRRGEERRGWTRKTAKRKEKQEHIFSARYLARTFLLSILSSFEMGNFPSCPTGKSLPWPLTGGVQEMSPIS